MIISPRSELLAWGLGPSLELDKAWGHGGRSKQCVTTVAT